MTTIQNSSKLFKEFKEDFDYCEEIIKKHSKTFYAGFSLLPKEEAMSVYAVYAFCRKADDLVDEEANAEGLKHLKEDLKLFEEGKEKDHPVWRALRVVFSTYDMDIAPFYEMIEGQEMDLSFTQPETQEDLEDYSYYVASTVGLMLLPLIAKHPKKLKEDAIALGKAMQITNILRDIGEDLENNRLYLPKNVMEKFGYTRDMLERHEISEKFIALWEYEAQIAEAYYEQSLNLLDNLNKEARNPLYLSLIFYKEILEVVRENSYDCFTKRAIVGKRRKMRLLKRAEQTIK